MIPLEMTSYQQSALAELCQIVSTPAYRLRCGEMPDKETVYNDLVNSLLRFDKINWGTMYDILHRSGANT